jgi:hypothetical protein
MHKCNALIDKSQHKHLLQMKPFAPQLNALIKTHKKDKPIRPVISNMRAPSYKLAKHLNKKLNQYSYHTYAARNSNEVALDLKHVRVTNQLKIAALEIQDLYVKLPTRNIINITKY